MNRSCYLCAKYKCIKILKCTEIRSLCRSLKESLNNKTREKRNNFTKYLPQYGLLCYMCLLLIRIVLD